MSFFDVTGAGNVSRESTSRPVITAARGAQVGTIHKLRPGYKSRLNFRNYILIGQNIEIGIRGIAGGA